MKPPELCGHENTRVALFQILEDVIDAHVKAFKSGHIVEGCYLDKPFEEALKKVRQLPTASSSPREHDIEALAAETHKIYCEAYEKRHGKPYWTNGDYSKLDEPTKEYDRFFVRWAIKRFNGTAAGRALDAKRLFDKHIRPHLEEGVQLSDSAVEACYDSFAEDVAKFSQPAVTPDPKNNIADDQPPFIDEIGVISSESWEMLKTIPKKEIIGILKEAVEFGQEKQKSIDRRFKNRDVPSPDANKGLEPVWPPERKIKNQSMMFKVRARAYNHGRADAILAYEQAKEEAGG